MTTAVILLLGVEPTMTEFRMTEPVSQSNPDRQIYWYKAFLSKTTTLRSAGSEKGIGYSSSLLDGVSRRRCYGNRAQGRDSYDASHRSTHDSRYIS